MADDGGVWAKVYPNAMAAIGGGKILQVVSTTKTDTFTVTSSTFTDVTSLNVSITPSSSANKIMIFTSMAWQPDANSCHGRIMRDATPIMVGAAAGSRTQTSFSTRFVSVNDIFTTSAVYLDSPATTSSVTYKIQVRHEGSGTVYVNRSSQDSDLVQYGRGASTISVIEVSA